MDLVSLPHGLLEFYGALVLACGIGLGVIVGRNWKRRPSSTDPEPAELLQRRLLLLEQDLDLTRAELERLASDRELLRELRPPRTRINAA